MPQPYVTGFDVPSLDEIIARVEGDIATLPSASAYTPGSDAWVIARVLAGLSYLQHGHTETVLREWFPETATAENLPRLAARWGLTRNLPTAARYLIRVTATVAQTVPAGSLLTSETGVEYETETALVFGAPGTATVYALCNDTGTIGSLDVGATLTFVVAIPDIEAAATVEADAGNADGADAEALEALRLRLLHRIALTPHGGRLTDYEAWALDLDGVDRAWATSPTLGTVYLVFDGAAAEVDVLAGVTADKPVTVTLTAEKGTEYTVAPIMHVKVATDYLQATVQASIVAALEALAEARGSTSTTIYNSEWRQAVANAPGVEWYTISDFRLAGVLTGSPNSDATTPANQWHAADAAAIIAGLTWA